MADYKQIASEKLASLPIAKHLTDVQEDISGIKKWRKGEKAVFNGLTIFAVLLLGGVFAVFGYKLLMNYLLPIIGIMAQYVIVGATLVTCWFMWPVFTRFLKNLSEKLTKLLIADNPFGELYKQLSIMVGSKDKFTDARGKIRQLITNLHQLAKQNQTEAINAQSTFKSALEKAKQAKDKMNALQPNEVDGDESDAYIDAQIIFEQENAKASRLQNLFEQKNTFAQKYADRGATLEKMDRRLRKVGSTIDIKIADFKQTIEMLKNEYEVAHNLRTATDVAKQALIFDTRWELDYAMDIITETISINLARTTANLNDIETTTSILLGNIDDDAAFERMSKLADEMTSGKVTVVEVDKYKNPNYKRTKSDRELNAGFGEGF